jgi:hypothetical protein
MPVRPGLTGWVDDPIAVEDVIQALPHPIFFSSARSMQGSGAGQTVLLYKAWQEVCGSYYYYPPQEIGCCVGRGFCSGVELLSCVEKAKGVDRDEFRHISHEAIYGMSRTEPDCGNGKLQGQDGSLGAWAAKAVSTHGTISRQETGYQYDDAVAKAWGDRGVPADVKQTSLGHIVRTVSLVATWSELEDAMANGYPVPICSKLGFTMTRDKDGFCMVRGTWGHCMCCIGIRQDRPGACILQSWGEDVPDGPLALDQPTNSFWIERKDMERVLAERDSWALCNHQGYPSPTPIPARWTWSGFA